jgi:hypothetical protein
LKCSESSVQKILKYYKQEGIVKVSKGSWHLT